MKLKRKDVLFMANDFKKHPDLKEYWLPFTRVTRCKKDKEVVLPINQGLFFKDDFAKLPKDIIIYIHKGKLIKPKR